jgi:hypothetical protein
MIGITSDHEFKTRDGWKYFDDIDIQKDELYCWRFKETDEDPCDLWYCDSYEQNGKQIIDRANFYIKPDNKLFYSKNDCDLFQIKNDYIDTTVTSNYTIPIVMENFDNRYDNWSELCSITDLYKSLYNLQKKTNTLEYDECGYYGFTEKFINPISPNTWYGLRNLMFKLELSNFKRLTIKDKNIVCFIMPKIIEQNVSWRVYVRRNGKEFWL